MPIPGPRLMLPFAPIYEAAKRRVGTPDASLAEVARVLDVADRSVIRWVSSNEISWYAADRLCVERLMMHPYLLYGDVFWHGIKGGPHPEKLDRRTLAPSVA